MAPGAVGEPNDGRRAGGKEFVHLQRLHELLPLAGGSGNEGDGQELGREVGSGHIVGYGIHGWMIGLIVAVADCFYISLMIV